MNRRVSLYSNTVRQDSFGQDHLVTQETPSSDVMASDVTPERRHEHEHEPVRSSVVNGTGQWDAWRRNFATPLLAFLDLFDNALDATMSDNDNDDKPSRITVKSDQPHGAQQQSDNDTTGLVMTNNSLAPIKPMAEILRVYNSVKGQGSNNSNNGTRQHIGQNGVGLKQGCATLSSCSFCLVKSTSSTGVVSFGLGILAASLQSEHQCFLPVLEGLLGPSTERKAYLQDWARQNRNIAHCVAEYGQGYFMQGIERLDRHFEHMTNGVWSQHDHVFRLVLFGLLHEKSDSSGDGESDSDSEHEDAQGDRVRGLVNELVQDLPMRYIHVPPNVDVTICGKKVTFSYWQHRMADMTEFNLKIGKIKSFTKDNSWKTAQDSDDGCYSMRVYIGFDFKRLTQDRGQSALNMYVYSRRAGRLILRNLDAKAILRLPGGSTTFCQGMTILVDDRMGNLPLNPTKQDLAFTEESHGEIHRQNLFAWLQAAAKVYYRHYFELCYNSSKEIVSEAVKWVAARAQEMDEIPIFPALHHCVFNTFEGDLVSAILNGRLKLAQAKSSTIAMGQHAQTFRMPSMEVLKKDRNLAPLFSKKRKRKSKGNSARATAVDDLNETLAEKEAEIALLDEKVRELQAQSATETTFEMSDRIEQLESELQDASCRCEELETSRALLKMDNDLMRKEVRRLKATMKEKDQALEQYRKTFHRESGGDEDLSSYV